MRHPRVLRLALLGVFALTTTAHSQVTSTDAVCRTAIQKAAAKVAVSTLKALGKCTAGVMKGSLPASTDCIAKATSASATAAAESLVMKQVSAHCDATTNAAALARFARCPSPGHASDDGGATSGIDSFAEVASCQAALDTEYVASLGPYVLSGGPNVSAPGYKCATTIQKGITKLWKTVSKEHASCQRASDLSATGAYDYVCDAISNTKISELVDKTVALIVSRCNGLTTSELASLHSCDVTAEGIADCALDATIRNAEGLTANAYGHVGQCPTELRIVSRRGNADGARVTASRIDAGWTGLAHDGDFFEGFALGLALSCSTADCEACAISATCDEGNCRCSNDPKIPCTMPYAPGGPCGAGACAVQFGPPRPRSVGGVPVCIVDATTAPLGGTADAGSGAMSLAWRNTQRIYLGISQAQPCPRCSAASIGESGICNGGSRNGLACTTNAIDPDFGPASYDCPPTPASELTLPDGFGFDVVLTDAPTSLGASLACDPPSESDLCHCGTCSGDVTLACADDTTCAAAGAGTCGAGPGAARRPNVCDDSICSPVTAGSSEGVCNGGPVDLFCDGFLRANGEGFVPCSADVDCTAVDPGAGACTQTRKRDCFLDTIARSGVATPSGAVVGWVGCMPASPSGAVNSAIGLPGPARRNLAVRYEFYCADGTTAFELGGSVCP